MSISTEISRITTLRTSIASKLDDLGFRVFSYIGYITQSGQPIQFAYPGGFGVLENCNTQYFTAGKRVHIVLHLMWGYELIGDAEILHDEVGNFDYCEVKNSDIRFYVSNEQNNTDVAISEGELLAQAIMSFDGGTTYEVPLDPYDEHYVTIECYELNAPSTLSECYSVLSSVTGLSAMSYTPTTTAQTISAGQYLSGEQTINAIPSAYIIPSGTITLSSSGTFNVKSYASANVTVTGGTGKENEIIDRTISGTYENSTVSTIGSCAFYNCGNLYSVNFPSVNTVYYSAFYYCSKLLTVNLPEVTEIKGSAFLACYSLKTINAPNLKSIDTTAFCTCSSLYSVSFPKVTYISTSAFWRCSSLTSVYCPSVTTIGLCAFSSCSNLTYVDFTSVGTMGYGAFFGCSNLRTISLPNVSKLSSIIFANCVLLESIDLPKYSYSASTPYLFSNCGSLSCMSFGQASKLSGNSMAYNCANLISIFLLGSSLCQLGNTIASMFGTTPVSVYTGTAKRVASIYVPSSLLASYKAATNWTTISSKIFAYEDYFGTIGSFGYVDSNWTPLIDATLYSESYVTSYNGWRVGHFSELENYSESHCIVEFNGIVYPLATWSSNSICFGAPFYDNSSYYYNYYGFAIDISTGNVYAKYAASRSDYTFKFYSQLP